MAEVLVDSEAVKRLANNATGGNVTKVTCPPGTIAVILESVSAAGKVSHTGVDGDPMGSDYVDLVAGTPYTLPLSFPGWGTPSAPVFYVSHASNSGVTVIVPVRR